jgi:WD domain, G-beta repeat
VTTVLQGHADTITAAIFSPDGTRIATASRDDTVRIWSADTGAELKVLKNPKPSGIDLSHDGTRVLISSADSSTRIWDVATGRETVLQGQAANAKFSPDGNRIVSESSSLNAPAVTRRKKVMFAVAGSVAEHCWQRFSFADTLDHWGEPDAMSESDWAGAGCTPGEPSSNLLRIIEHTFSLFNPGTGILWPALIRETRSLITKLGASEGVCVQPL